MRDLDHFFASSPDEPLYHYTGVGALLGAAKSKSLWASHVYYLNDSKEIVHACEVLETLLRPKVAAAGNATEALFLTQLMDWIKRFQATEYCLFVFSLSEEASLLSQWRSYTPHGKGVSLGFSPTVLASIARKSDLRLARCLYQTFEHEEVLNSLIEKLLYTFRIRPPVIDPRAAVAEQCYHPFLEGFRGEVLQVLAIVKHREFREEREWRLISPYYPRYVTPKISFREGASMLIPYIELPLPVDDGPVFDTVTLGPSSHEPLSISALSMFLSNQRLCNTVCSSNIPYRKWS